MENYRNNFFDSSDIINNSSSKINMMKIDKQVDDICYNDEFHKYWDSKSNTFATSVTTFISEFHKKMDKEYWLTYKALERVMKPRDWVQFKSTLDKERESISVPDKVDLAIYESVREEIALEWKKKNADSLTRGTKIHNDFEDKWKSKDEWMLWDRVFKVGRDYDLSKLEFGIYPELMVYYNKGGIFLAGQSDLVIRDGNKIHINDYKTNRKIDKTNYFQKMLHPIGHLDDCNFIHYTLQLSMYMFMILDKNPTWEPGLIWLTHYDHSGNKTDIRLKYMEKEVKALLGRV